ncbi:WD40 repeat domain-containing protein [Hyalangium rubrum]|uniref:WD40 repeat domain-containing protein n=1 Tax=Hyalangium rubrum TaxID=3103134 RepID=A0ABU5H4L5_9BACT|nr:WD40 repeat domain-containing protein [Hyalangium sp. s54d21]MDY7227035.1 WD40 repeat domain-containing protein [Hyalangium sp. s54d21]
MTDELSALTELPTLERLVKAEGVEALLAALDAALSRLPADARVRKEDSLTVGPRTLRILRSAVALDSGFLREHPEALFQSLYNRLRWFDAPDTAAHFTPEGKGPWSHPEAHLYALAQQWRRQHEARGGAPWLESLLPLPGELESEDQVLPHGAHVLCAAYNPTGTRLATGSWDDGQNVRIWDVATGQCIHVLEGHEGEVLGLAWSADGTRLASGSRDHDARLWDAETGELLHEMTGQEGRVTSVAFSPDGRLLAAANLGWRVRLFDVASGEEVRTLEGHEQSALCVAFHPSGRWLATGSSDETARIWDVATGTQVACIQAGTLVQDLEFSSDGEWLALTASEGIALVETEGWTQVRKAGGKDPYSHVAWLGTARLGVLTYNRLEVLDARSGDVLRTRPYESDGHERGVAFHPAGQRFALTAVDGKVRVSEMDSEPAPTLLTEKERVQNLWGRPEGEVAIVRRMDATLAVDARGHIRSFAPDYEEAYGQAWKTSPHDTLLAYPVSLMEEESSRLGIRLLDVKSLTPVRALSVNPGGEQGERALFLEERPMAFSPDGQLLAGVVEPGKVRVWRVADGALLHSLGGHEGPVTLVDFTPDGTCVVSGSPKGSRLLLHEVKGGTAVVDTEALVKPAPAYAAAAHAPWIAVGRGSGELELFEVPTGTRRVIQAAEAPVIGVGLSADGARVAACCRDEVVRIFDARTGALVRELPHPALAFSVALGEGVVVTMANDQCARFFELATGAPLREIQASVTPREAVGQRFWEALGDGPFALYRREEPEPLVHFQDAMEASVLLRDGLIVGRGRSERDMLYVLKLHLPSRARP